MAMRTMDERNALVTTNNLCVLCEKLAHSYFELKQSLQRGRKIEQQTMQLEEVLYIRITQAVMSKRCEARAASARRHSHAPLFHAPKTGPETNSSCACLLM